MHIGLIGGIGPAATEFYYRGLIDRHAKAGTTPDLTIVHADVRDMAANLASGAAQKQADIFVRLLQRLAAAGAELAAVTSMGGHFCIRELEECHVYRPNPGPTENCAGPANACAARGKRSAAPV